jgi:hypothetical protein
MAGMSILAIIMVYTWRREGLNSHFWWSLLIVLVVATLILTFRYYRERWRSESSGPHPNNRQPSGLN